MFGVGEVLDRAVVRVDRSYLFLASSRSTGIVGGTVDRTVCLSGVLAGRGVLSKRMSQEVKISSNVSAVAGAMVLGRG